MEAEVPSVVVNRISVSRVSSTATILTRELQRKGGTREDMKFMEIVESLKI